jgi:hypothetical protein
METLVSEEAVTYRRRTGAQSPPRYEWDRIEEVNLACAKSPVVSLYQNLEVEEGARPIVHQ